MVSPKSYVYSLNLTNGVQIPWMVPRLDGWYPSPMDGVQILWMVSKPQVYENLTPTRGGNIFYIHKAGAPLFTWV